jgi:hypothetical protein
MVIALAANIYPAPDAPYRYFPYIYLVYLAMAALVCWRGRRRIARG